MAKRCGFGDGADGDGACDGDDDRNGDGNGNRAIGQTPKLLTVLPYS